MILQDNLVTGTSILSAGGIGIEEVWQSILEKRQKITQRIKTLRDSESIQYPVYEIEKFDLSNWLSKKQIDVMVENHLIDDLDFRLLVLSSILALKNAKLQVNPNSKVSLIVAHENPGVVSLIDRMFMDDDYINKARNVREKFALHQQQFYNLQSFPHLFYLAKILNISGSTFIVNNACASGTYALELGNLLIKSKQSDVVLIVSSDYAHFTEYLWLQQRGFCSESGVIRPFDKNRDGTVLGDSASGIVLESSNHAAARNAPVKCCYQGAVLQQDHWKMTLPDVSKHTYSNIIKKIMGDLNIHQLDLLVPHATGSPLWDKYEANQIAKCFQEKAMPLITAFKPYIGHSLGASSLSETVLLIQSLIANTIPPILNYGEVDHKIPLPTIATKFEYKDLHHVMKTVSAYGGFHSASLFSKI
ncbi:beta-ketoacyl synthase N-terminal-like domain-containing protein [Chengkuizengella sediminis]|uniref:beta-ketoacyl synthase N-terminal-like domain-containing protein n=1 Tax=Chengkuizengella sediminis TaxID=1885917 RepID=UPI001389EA31|nr:beta-ketoacyl synthase N-terminal-like domain-containing protein [Chengkuizengella sediminis]NDI35946.1 beta-ketoacyl synthase [Chengkuizengella sediminis]